MADKASIKEEKTHMPPTTKYHVRTDAHDNRCHKRKVLVIYCLEILLATFLGWVALYATLADGENVAGEYSDALLYDGRVFSVMLLVLCAMATGWIGETFMNMPSLLGMLITGIVLQNLPGGPIDSIPSSWSSFLRSAALAVILVRAGLGLNLGKLQALGLPVLCLSVLPGTCEAVMAATLAHTLIDLPWDYAFALGFVLAAVSPAVVVPSLLALQQRGFGVDKGIPTMVLAAASFDDVLAISVFGIIVGIAFSGAEEQDDSSRSTTNGSSQNNGTTSSNDDNTDLVMDILQAPIEVFGGIVSGVALGVVITMLLYLHVYRLRHGSEVGADPIERRVSISLSNAKRWGCVAAAQVEHREERKGCGGKEDGDDGSSNGEESQPRPTLRYDSYNAVPTTPGVDFTDRPGPVTRVANEITEMQVEPQRLQQRKLRSDLCTRFDDCRRKVISWFKLQSQYAAPLTSESHSLMLAAILLCAVGAVVGARTINYTGGGALASIVMSLFAARVWPPDLVTRVGLALKNTWWIAQPVLFGLIGSTVLVRFLEGDVVWKGAIVLIGGMALRLVVTYGVCSMPSANLTQRERVFVTMAWLPKATVQAAIGSLVLDIARQKKLDEEEEYGEIIVTIAVLSIVVTAPLGAIAIAWLGPKLLTQASSAQQDKRSRSATAVAQREEGWPTRNQNESEDIVVGDGGCEEVSI